MYPTISELIKDLFGIDNLLPFHTYGFFIFLAFYISYLVGAHELKRKEKQGLIKYATKRVWIGAPAKLSELILSAVLGFIIGFKFVKIIFNYSSFVAQPKNFLFTTKGDVLGGVLGLVITVFFVWRSYNKRKLETPKWVTKKIKSKEYAGKIILVASFFGLLGTKIFSDLENWELLIAKPVETIFSFGGMSFFGGLVVGGIAVYIYVRKYSIAIIHLLDCAALAIPIGYAIGRIGCQVAGDGCWGVYNEAFATPGAIPAIAYELGHVASFSPPNWLSFLPDWFFAYDYPHNIINRGIVISDCTWDHCRVLAAPVFPTPLYETLLMLLIFGVLIYMRKKLKTPGMLFTFYLIFAGLERFFIEKIRINSNYNFWGIEVTQAEIVSVSMLVIGFLTLAYLYKNKKKLTTKYGAVS